MSFFDIFQSLSQAASSLPMPNDHWGGIGNETTCDIQGFMGTLGLVGTVLYSLSLSIYFLLVIKYDMSEAKIKKEVEPYLHAGPLLYTIAVSVYLYATNNYNPAGPICWIESHHHVDGKHDLIPRVIGSSIPSILAFILNITIMIQIRREVYLQSKVSKALRSSWVVPPSSTNVAVDIEMGSKVSSDENNQEETATRTLISISFSKLCFWIRNEDSNPSSSTSRTTTIAPSSEPSPLVARLSRPSLASILRLREISSRAIAYIIGFILTYSLSALHRTLETHKVDVPFVLVFLTRVFYPLQGLFNVLIYSYPHVVTYRRNHSEYSWVQAFCEVIKSGGDSDQIRTGRGRRTSLRQQQRVLEQCRNRRNSITGSTDNVRQNAAAEA